MEFIKAHGKNILSAAALSMGSIMLLGCVGGSEILPGQPAEVIDREYDDTDIEYYASRKGPISMVDPESYNLTVRQCGRADDASANEDGCVVKQVEVTKEVYDSHPVGSTIVFNE